MFNLTKKETKFILICSLVLVVLTSFSYLLGSEVSKSSGDRYLGTNLRYHVDVGVYYSYIEQAKEGYTVFENLFTSEEQPRLFIAPTWYVIGWLAGLFNISTFLAFHIFRILLIPILVLVAYLFTAKFFKEIFKRMIATYIFLFAGGLGFFFMSRFFSFTKPIDLWLAESIPFLTAYHSPNWILALILILVIYQLLLHYQKNNKKYIFLLAIVLTIALGFIHPYDLTVIFVVYGYFMIYQGIKQKQLILSIRRLLVFVFFSSLPIFYFFALRSTDPVFAGWFSQNVTQLRSISSVIFSFLLLFILVIPGLIKYYKDKGKSDVKFFIIIWFLLNFTLIYLPLVFIGRRLVLGFMFPISILATVGLFHLADKIAAFGKPGLKKIFIITILVVLPATNIFVLVLDNVAMVSYPDPPLYLSSDYVEALDFLKKNSSPDEITLACYNISNILPGQINRKVYSGHPHQTVNFTEKDKTVSSFYVTNNLDYMKNAWLKESQISYIIYGPEEKKLQEEYNLYNKYPYRPQDKYYLESVFENETVVIYAVI